MVLLGKFGAPRASQLGVVVSQVRLHTSELQVGLDTIISII